MILEIQEETVITQLELQVVVEEVLGELLLLAIQLLVPLEHLLYLVVVLVAMQDYGMLIMERRRCLVLVVVVEEQVRFIIIIPRVEMDILVR